jgi:nitrogen fixation/metabolism regulation signal transduction histidine kinase
LLCSSIPSVFAALSAIFSLLFNKSRATVLDRTQCRTTLLTARLVGFISVSKSKPGTIVVSVTHCTENSTIQCLFNQNMVGLLKQAVRVGAFSLASSLAYRFWGGPATPLSSCSLVAWRRREAFR